MFYICETLEAQKLDKNIVLNNFQDSGKIILKINARWTAARLHSVFSIMASGLQS